MTKENLTKWKKQAFEEGSKDSLLSEILREHALLFVEQDVAEEEISDDDLETIITAYELGFLKTALS